MHFCLLQLKQKSYGAPYGAFQRACTQADVTVSSAEAMQRNAVTAYAYPRQQRIFELVVKVFNRALHYSRNLDTSVM
jgi:hypothetical protein